MNMDTENMVPTHYPASFKADASQICPGCALELYGQWVNGLNIVHDNEGNEVYPIFEWEDDNAYACDRCDPLIAEEELYHTYMMNTSMYMC